MPADADGDTMPPADAPAPLVSINQDGSGLPDDQIQIWNATVNWDGSPSMTVTHESDVQAAAFDENLCDFGACIPQPGTSVRLQTLSDRIMFRAQYRNFGGWETIVTSHSVDVGSDRAGARWYHLEKQGSDLWGMRDQGTYAPADALNRWMPSAAMDKSGNIAVGYSTANGTAPNYPSIRYATRLATDPPGELGSEETIMVGTGSQTGTVEPLGRLLEHVRGSGRRLHLLLHDGVHPDHRHDDLADPRWQVHDPDVRAAAESATATAATGAAAATTAAPASNG